MHTLFPRITIDRKVQFGAPAVQGTRVPVATIIGHIVAGTTIEEVMQEYRHGRIRIHPCLWYRALTRAKKVVAGAGNFEQALHMTAKEFLKATQAKLGDFSEKAKLKLQVKTKKK